MKKILSVILLTVLFLTACVESKTMSSSSDNKPAKLFVDPNIKIVRNPSYIDSNNQFQIFYFNGDILFDGDNLYKLSDPAFFMEISPSQKFAGFFHQSGDWIYFKTEESIKRGSLNTKSVETIYSHSTALNTSFYPVYGEDCIYINVQTEGKYTVYQIDYNDGNLQKTTDDGKEVIAVSKDFLYYRTNQGKILQSDLKNNQLKTISDDGSYVRIYDNTFYFGLYYSLEDNRPTASKVHKYFYCYNNSAVKKASDLTGFDILKVNDTIIYYGYNDSFTIYDLITQKKEVHPISGVFSMYYQNNTLYYFRINAEKVFFCQYDFNSHKEIIVHSRNQYDGEFAE